MKRNPLLIAKRKKLINLSIVDKSSAAEVLRNYANQIENSQGTAQTVLIVSELLGVSEATIYRDISG